MYKSNISAQATREEDIRRQFTMASPKKLLVITGFGPFAGVDRNPTQEIVEELRESFLTVGNAEGGESIPVVYHVLEVSVIGCENALNSITVEFPDTEITFLHLGVDARAEHIKFEQFGYNNMTFRVPDAREHQPQNKAIHPAFSFDLGLQCCWDVPKLIQDLPFADTNECDSLRAKLQPSTNPGRFLCNYIYFRSLLFRNRSANSRSLFVHVPPFTQVSKVEQIAVVKALAYALVLQSDKFDKNSIIAEQNEVLNQIPVEQFGGV